MMMLSFLFILISCHATLADINLISSSLSVSQSSTGWNGYANRAVDGNSNGNFWSQSCTHSAGVSDNWWKVNLGRVSKINQVFIHGRTDCCQNRLDNALVYAGDQFCGAIKYQYDGQSFFSVNCNGAYADSIRVVQNYNYLTLCEVSVFGDETNHQLSSSFPLENLVSGKYLPTAQTSEGWSGAAPRAIDGRTNGLWSSSTCTHSGNTGRNHWQVDLLSRHFIQKVVIYNRRDCCQNRINGVQVFVGDTLCGSIRYVTGQDVYTVECGMFGRVVKVAQNGQYLTLCEVEVLGH